MKKIILFMILFLFSMGKNVQGSEGFVMEDFDLTESFQSLQEHDYQKELGKEILQELQEGNIKEVFLLVGTWIKEKTIGELLSLRKIILNFMVLVLISALFTNFSNAFSKNGVSDTAFYICYLSGISMMISLFDMVVQLGIGFMEFVVAFMSATIPTYFVAVSLLGQASATGFYHFMLISIGMVNYLFLKVFVPLIKVYLTVGLINNISKEKLLSKFCEFLRYIMKKGSKFLVGGIIGINLLQSLLLPNIDATKNSMVMKMAQSIPGIGTSIGGYSGVLVGSLHLIKNVIGGYAIVVLLLICLVPYIKIQCYHLALQLLLAMSQPVAEQRIVSGFQIVADSMEMLANLVLSIGILFIVGIAIVCVSTNYIR
ncbi:MAG: stage III sporulation protein AE [Eubacterium sp.]|nr:stage III sporulation protein AE [Eubacterium sp.]